jgi:Ni,Fe-hydrogenase III small subunit
MFNKIFRTGVVTEEPASDAEIEQLAPELKRMVDKQFRGSLAIRMVDAGSCNGCELEIHALNNPYYAIERYGVHFVASPRHADALLVTGPVSRHMEAALIATYAAMAKPCYVIASGDCACNGGEFGVNYASCGAVENVLPVDLKIPGCPPSPAQLTRGLLILMGQREPVQR